MKLARLAWATMAAAALLLAPAAFAQGVVDDGDPVVASASSDSFRLDTREGPFESDGTETLAYSTLWHPAGDATVTILQDGEEEPVAAELAGGAELERACAAANAAAGLSVTKRYVLPSIPHSSKQV